MNSAARKFHHKTPILNGNDSFQGLDKEISRLLKQAEGSHLPLELKESLGETLLRLSRAMKYSFYQAEYEQITKYAEIVINLPWDKRGQDNLDLEKSKQILDKNHFGLEKIKERILEYISVLKLQSEKDKVDVLRFSRSPILCFVGLPGTGKTS